MTSLPDEAPEKFALFYPNHKQFGVLAFILALLHLYLRFRHRAVLPASPAALKSWEVTLSHLVHRAIIALVLAVPLLGYGMSSTFTLSDGVPFFGLEIPELLPKNDDAFAVFQALHRYAAYTLLALVALHVAGALKHWLLDRGGDTDVLPRMM